MKALDILPKLERVRATSNGWIARCPVHDDRRPSLSIREECGNLLLYCHAGCSFEAIMTMLNQHINQPNFAPDTNSPSKNGFSAAKKTRTPVSKVPAGEYDYFDKNHELLFQIIRTQINFAEGPPEKTFRARRRPKNGETPSPDGWVYNLQGTKLVLYNLPEIMTADMVFVVEGEKDVQTLQTQGLPATCNPFGAGKWRDDYNEFLRSKKVVILPDNDQTGQKHAQTIAASLCGVAAELFIVTIPDPKEKGDVTDFFESGGTVEKLVEMVKKTEAWTPTKRPLGEEYSAESDNIDPKRPELSPETLYGLAGEIVRVIEPHTEADNAALLIQLLAGFGCLIGKTAYFCAEADQHHTKIFAVLVGATSKGRKGSSFGQVRRLLARVDETFLDCIQDGLSSGEGLIYHVRDPQEKKVPIKERGRIVGYQDEIVDQGATEKRAFVVEPEFARVLRVMTRDGNILSSVIRQAWDFDSLRVMTKNPIRATGAHISIIGHITKGELQRNLDETETANGFANRFLWVYTTRSKFLPEGGSLQNSELNDVVEKLNKAIRHARTLHELKRDEQARQKWIEVYPDLSSGNLGLLGSVTSRAEAQVMRLACLYALFDCSGVIQIEHLNAALALWKYCEDSARYIFGDQTGNRTADTIYAALLGNEGLSKTQLRDLFQRNLTARQINSALGLLIDFGKVEVCKEETEGRPREIFKIKTVVSNDINDKSLVIGA